MELRSTRQRQESVEFKELKITLMGLGFYESGMELQEMRQLMIAVQASMSQNLPGPIEYDMEQALKESELDFMHTQDVLNSTMISSLNTCSMERSDPVSIPAKSSFYRRNSSSPFSSPEASPQQLIIEAEVHHELNWSPPKQEAFISIAANESRTWSTRKRMSTDLEAEVSAEPRIEVVAKRSRTAPWRPPFNRSPTGESNDSGVSFLSNATATTTEPSESNSSVSMSPPPNYVNEEANDEDRDIDYHNHSAEPSF